MDAFLLEAMREVDALYPDTPPIAPALCKGCGAEQHTRTGTCLGIFPNPPLYLMKPSAQQPRPESVDLAKLNVPEAPSAEVRPVINTGRWIGELHAAPLPPTSRFPAPPPLPAPDRNIFEKVWK